MSATTDDEKLLALADEVKRELSFYICSDGHRDILVRVENALRTAAQPAPAHVGIGWRASLHEPDGPNECGYYTAGIDTPTTDIFGKPDWHYSAIEFHSKDKAEALRRRDYVMTALLAHDQQVKA